MLILSKKLRMSFSSRSLLLLSFVFLAGFPAWSQGNSSRTEILKKIRTVEEAEKMLAKLDPNFMSIGRFNAIVDSVEYKEITRNYKIGDVFFGRKSTYKILKKEKETVYRCQYIFLDGNVHSQQKIDSLSNEIIARFQSGTSFRTLSDRYSMDGNKNGGELGWFHKERMG